MTQINLFNDEIPLKELEDNKDSFEWFKNKSILLTDCSEDELNRYYSIKYSYLNPPLYLMDFTNARIEDKSSMRCMFIDVDSHTVLIVFRLIQLMRTRRIHLFDIPLSFDSESSMKVLNIMKNSSVTTCIFKEKYNGLFNECYPKESYNDYYYDLEKDDKELFSNNDWQKDIGIRKFMSDSGKYQIVNIQGKKEYFQSAIECRNTWWNGKEEDGRDVKMKFFLNSLKFPFDKIWNIALVHENKVLAVKTLLLHKEYAVMLLFFHVSRQYKELREQGIDNIVLRHLDKCMRYASGKALLQQGIKREYLLGFAPGNTSLQHHKECHADGVVRYFQNRKQA